MKSEHPSSDRRRPSPAKRASYLAPAAAAVVLVCALAVVLLPGLLANWFLKPALIAAVAEAYPAYSIHLGDMTYRITANRVDVDSLALHSADGTFIGTTGPFSVGGITWMNALWNGGFDSSDFERMVVDAQGIEMQFLSSDYVLRCPRFRVSVPDSMMEIDSLALQPSVDDELLFGTRAFRITRFRVVVPHCRVMGLACLDLMQGKMYRTRAIRIHDPALDILINKDKPNERDTSHPLMPNEMLSSMRTALQVDSVSVTNGRIRYGERHAVGARPSLITVDSIQVVAGGIVNRGAPDAPAVIHAQGQLMKAGTMKVRMTLPAASPEFSFRYSGSLSAMHLSALNAHLEPSEHMRITAGILREATFDITVASGRATGRVRPVYRDLTVAAINRSTGSEAGASDVIVSFIANTFTIRGTNVPDETGAMKIGQVHYARKQDDPFFGFVWVALRSGVQDVVGW